MSGPHIPDVVTSKDTAGRWRAACLACMDGSVPSFHRPIADEWRREHLKQAVPLNPTPTRSKP